MRAFWAVLGVLMIVAAAYLLAGPQPAQSSRIEVIEPGQRAEMDRPVPAPAPPSEASSAVTTADRAVPQPPAPLSPPDVKPPEAASTPPVEPRQAPDAENPKPKPEPEIPATMQAPAAPTPAGPASPAHEPKIVTNDDGSIIVDGKWLIKGKGTVEEPYQVSWDQLVAVQEDYAPKEGRETIPAHIKMLDGKQVQITGNVAFPLMMDDAEECLVMLNQWDGCCIGIPPTPYDAIEVKLKEVVKGDARMTTFGTLKGRLRVEPHLVGGWLVGLYLMDQATLAPQAYGGFAP
jgi:hypothetical protein